jgi:zinc protease
MKRTIVLLLSIWFALNMGLTPAAAAQLTKVTTDAATGISEYKLSSNGLQVLLAERHHTPLVTVMVVYHVGSRNEAVGYTGSTHFLEHMLFTGTPKHDPKKGTGIDDVLKPIGGINNATTSYDRTNYFETLPSKYLEVALELEADRMRNALLRAEDHNTEMTVVRNELERNEDDPNRLLDVNLFAHAFLAHPYHHPIIGWRSDVEGVPVERLRQFYNDFYYPNNATLVVIGDFNTETALQQIEKYFGPIPKAPKEFPDVYTQEPPQLGERRFVVRRGEDLPKVQIGFRTPNAVDKDSYPLEIAAAILGDDRKQASRLYKSLIDTNLASDTYAYNYSMRDPGMFTMFATATPGSSSDKIESTMFEQAQKLATQPITDEELDRAKRSIWKRIKLDAADPMGMASQLAEAIAVADWQWWVNLEKNIKAVSKEDVVPTQPSGTTIRPNRAARSKHSPQRRPRNPACSTSSFPIRKSASPNKRLHNPPPSLRKCKSKFCRTA